MLFVKTRYRQLRFLYVNLIRSINTILVIKLVSIHTMNELKQIKLIKWIEDHTIRVDVESLDLKGAYSITDVAKFTDELVSYLEAGKTKTKL